MVLPWLPATAMPYFWRISSASSSPRGITGIARRRASITSGFSERTALLTTTAFAPARFSAAWPSKITAPRAARRSVAGGQLQIRTGHAIAQLEQHFGEAGHTDASDADEVNVLGFKKHFNIVLFRLFNGLSMVGNSSRISPPPAAPLQAGRRSVRPVAIDSRTPGSVRDPFHFLHQARTRHFGVRHQARGASFLECFGVAELMLIARPWEAAPEWTASPPQPVR